MVLFIDCNNLPCNNYIACELQSHLNEIGDLILNINIEGKEETTYLILNIFEAQELINSLNYSIERIIKKATGKD